MPTMAIPDVEIFAAHSFAVWLQFICQMAPMTVVQELENLRE